MKKKHAPADPMEIFRWTLADLNSQLKDLINYEREEQERLAEMMNPEYTSMDGVYKGRTFAGARDAFISQCLEDLTGVYHDIEIVKGRIEEVGAIGGGGQSCSTIVLISRAGEERREHVKPLGK